PRMDEDALVYGTGSPYDPDFVVYGIYYSKVAGEGLLNPGGYHNPRADAAIEKGRHSASPEKRKGAYRQLKRSTNRAPALLCLVYPEHRDARRVDTCTGIKPQREPRAHGLLHGPWWKLADWKPQA